jgi:mannose-binding lectin 2
MGVSGPLLVTAAVVVGSAAAYNAVPAHSFHPPFLNFNNEGMRGIEGWYMGGSAELNENFLRLTPDRASRKGYIANVKPLSSPIFSTTLRFRVSGQGKKLFGDGFAMWFTTHPGYRDGQVHGFTDMFTGAGRLPVDPRGPVLTA